MKGGVGRWLLVAACCLGVFAPNYGQFQLPALAPEVSARYGLSASQFPLVFTAPMVPGILFSLVAGVLVDRFGIRWIVGGSVAVAALAACIKPFTTEFWGLYLCMLFTGMGATFLAANGPKAFATWFPAHRLDLPVGLFAAFSTLSMAVGIGTTALLGGVGPAFLAAAVVAVLSLALWVIGGRPGPLTGPGGPAGAPASGPGAEPGLPRPSMAQSLRRVVTTGPVWLAALGMGTAMAAGTTVNGVLPTALSARHGISAAAAGGYAAMITLGSVIGAIALPALVARLGRRRPVVAVLTVVAAVGMAFGWMVPAGPLLGVVLFLIGIPVGGMLPLLMTVPVQLARIGPVYAGTAGGVIGTLQLLGAVVGPSYVAAPLAGDNHALHFVLAAVFTLGFGLFAMLIPERGSPAMAPETSAPQPAA